MQLVEKQRLIEFAEALRSKLNYFDELENVRFDCDPAFLVSSTRLKIRVLARC